MVLTETELLTINAVRTLVPEMTHLKPESILYLWSEFSDSMSAQWLGHDTDTMKSFKNWAREEVYEDGE
jgi:hypothetical protein